MLHAQLFNLHTKTAHGLACAVVQGRLHYCEYNRYPQTMKLAKETFVITVFVLRAFIHAQFRILVGGTGRNVPPSFRSVPGFSNDRHVMQMH